MSSDPLSTNWPETWLRILLAGIPIPIPAFGSFLKAYEELIAAQQKEYIRQTLLDLENRLAKVERKEDFSAADAQIIITLLEKSGLNIMRKKGSASRVFWKLPL